MNRRDLLFLAGGLVTAPRALHAQQQAMPVIGFLSSIAPSSNAPCGQFPYRRSAPVFFAIFLLVSLALAAAAPARAQSSGKVWRLGVLTLPTSLATPIYQTFPQVVFPELAKHGFVDGKNLIIEMRIGPPDKLPKLARELVATRPDAVIAVSAWAIRAVKEASSTTPIIGSFIGEDPIVTGFAASLAHPGGSITGIVMLAPKLDAKRRYCQSACNIV